jgi:phosphatidylinositol-3-phosphatase
MRAWATTVVSIAALAALASGCASGSSSDAGPTPSASGPSTGVATDAATSSVSKVLVVIEENHTLEEMRQGMSFLSGLSHRYGYATHWSAITHPSEPNYLAIVGGSTFAIRDDGSPAEHADDVGDAPSVFDQALAAGRTAKTYAESMPNNCYASDAGDQDSAYAVRHNPWVFFSAGRAECLAHDVSLEPFAADAASNALPDVGLLVPNLDHDAHDGSLATADAWLEEQLTPVLRSSDFTSGRLVVIVTADEDDRSGDNRVLTSVLTPAISHKVVDAPLTHYSLTRYIAEVIGVRPLGEGARAPDLATAFGL